MKVINHLPHLEDLIFEGSEGLRKVSHVIKALAAGDYRNFTLKWDGAPAVFVGTDPSDGRKFVAKKSIFNRKPVVYKSYSEITDHINNERLREKMKVCLDHIPAPENGMVIQGDLMFTAEDLHETEISRGKALTFHPNAIRYHILDGKLLATRLRSSKLGWVPHTFYRTDAAFALTQIPRGFYNGGREAYTFPLSFNLQLGPIFRDDIDVFTDIKSYDVEHTTASMNAHYRDSAIVPIVDDFTYLYATITTRKDGMLRMITNRVAANQDIYMSFLLKDGTSAPTTHEGLVYNDGHFACKLVNRQEFSVANFSDLVVKGWN